MRMRDPIRSSALWIGLLALLVYLCYPFGARGWDRLADRYLPTVTREAQFRFGIPAPVPVILGQIQQESAWNPLAHSPAGAMGLMQFMPQTAQWADVAAGFGGVNAYNPAWSIRAGVWYDKWISDRIRQHETECDLWHFTLASYNGGLGNVYKRQALSDRPGSWRDTGILNPGVSAASQRENQSYSERIVHVHQPQFKSLGKTICR